MASPGDGRWYPDTLGPSVDEFAGLAPELYPAEGPLLLGSTGDRAADTISRVTGPETRPLVLLQSRWRRYRLMVPSTASIMRGWTLMCFTSACSTLGIVRVRMPWSKTASAFSVSNRSGSRRARSNVPTYSSRRWYSLSLLLVGLELARDRQRVAVDRDVDVLGCDARERQP